MDDKLAQLLEYLEKYYPDYVKEPELKAFGFRKELLLQAAQGGFVESSSRDGSLAYRLTAMGYMLYSQGKVQKIAESGSVSTAIGGYDNSAAYFEDLKMWIKVFIVLLAGSIFLGVIILLRVFSARF
ncbi:MAG: hypothetical protein HY367_00185 [Candidatus Aenigmarchaeota archaeon]|nr:hypothetical protein [Candidatus Aenigmarchaeota archaeon]